MSMSLGWRSFPLVENIEYRSFFIDAYLKTGLGVEGYIANEHTEADGHEQHRFEVLFDGEPDEEQAYGEHNEMLPCGVVESGKVPELCEVIHEKFAHNGNL